MPQADLSQTFRRVRSSLRSGDWLTPERLRVYPRMILFFVVAAILGLVATSHGAKDFAGRPLGVDFSGQWVAGTEVVSGYPLRPYDNAAHAEAQAAAFGPSASYLPWTYPPITLALAAAFATLPYLGALAAWMAATLTLYLAAVRRAWDASGHPASLLVGALAFPAAAVNLLHGQNGFLSAGLMTFGAFCLPRRPLLAGVLLALLAYKPQFLPAIPVVLVAGRFWRAGLAFGATLFALAAASALVFGTAAWRAFFESLAFSRVVILEGGGLESYKLQSAFAAVRLVGGSVQLAYGVQAAVTVSVLVTLARLWRRDEDARRKVAALLVASLLAAPYAMDYDMVLLGPALAALCAGAVDRGFRPYQKSLLALVWLMPLVARLAAFGAHLPLGLIGTLALYASIIGPAGRTAPSPSLLSTRA